MMKAKMKKPKNKNKEPKKFKHNQQVKKTNKIDIKYIIKNKICFS